jgi:hypothetical protein
MGTRMEASVLCFLEPGYDTTHVLVWIWVVVMLHHITYVTLITVMFILNLLVWRIGFGVTGMEFVGVMPTVQGFVRCATGSLWIVIIPKSMDRIMERPPMKTVQP